MSAAENEERLMRLFGMDMARVETSYTAIDDPRFVFSPFSPYVLTPYMGKCFSIKFVLQ